MAKKNGAHAAVEEKTSQTDASSSGLPLFFRNPHMLDVKRHAKSVIRPGSDYSFAASTNSIPLTTLEFIEASKHYPIVFTSGEQPLPVAIVGLERDNYFVKKDGHWAPGAYIPAYVRQYPFVFFERAEEKKFYLCIDEGAANFSLEADKNGTPLYDGDKVSAITQNALQFCTAFYNHHMITRNFCKDLRTHNLLIPYQSEIKLMSGKKLGLGGFEMIDEKAFNALPDDVFLMLRKKGWLPFIYLALSSASNWKRLADIAG